MTARDIRYGRQAGRWATSGTGRLLAELDDLRAQHQEAGTWPHPLDTSRRTHPDTIARSRAHDRTCPTTHPAGETCPAVADPGELAQLWAGRARTAAARHAAGVELDPIDCEALTRCTP